MLDNKNTVRHPSFVARHWCLNATADTESFCQAELQCLHLQQEPQCLCQMVGDLSEIKYVKI